MEKHKDTKNAEPEVEKDSLGQPNPAWDLEKKNIAAANKRAEEAAKSESAKEAGPKS